MAGVHNFQTTNPMPMRRSSPSMKIAFDT